MKVVWTSEARDRLLEIEAYIASQGSPHNAERFIQKIIQRAKILTDYPVSGRIVPEYPSGVFRELIENGYRIVYRIKSEVVEIITIYEPRRSLPIKD